MLSTTLRRRLPRTLPSLTRPFSLTTSQLKDTRVDEPSGSGLGSTTKDHINKSNDSSQEYIDQASQGKAAREKGTADTRADPGGMNKKAEQEHPEAPRPVIGMKEERGKSQE